MALKTPTLDAERVRKFRAEIDAFIDARVTELRKMHTGVPDAVVRQTITRGMGCQCAAYLEISAKYDAERGAA